MLARLSTREEEDEKKYCGQTEPCTALEVKSNNKGQQYQPYQKTGGRGKGKLTSMAEGQVYTFVRVTGRANRIGLLGIVGIKRSLMDR